MTGVSRRAVLGAAVLGGIATTAGCTGLGSSDDAPREDRADERVDGRWGCHHRTAENTRRTETGGPTAEPTVVWERSVGTRPFVDPVVTDSLAFEYAPADSVTHTVEVATGERTTAPTVDGRGEFVLAVDDDVHCLTRSGGEGSVVVGRAAGDGTEQWTASLPGAPSMRASLVDGVLYVSGFDRQWIRAIDAGDGTEHWTYETVGRVGSLAVEGELATFATGSYLFALDAVEGSRSWHREFDASFTTDAMAVGSAVVAGTDDGRVVAMRRSGEPAWTVDADTGAVTALAAANGRVFVGGEDGITALAVGTGDPLAETDTAASVDGLSVGGDRLYAATPDPALTALDRSSLDALWSRGLDRDPVGGPAVLDDTLLLRLGDVGTASGDTDQSLVRFGDR
ncbi:outer membrane protein assembly factor BamB family protein [Haloarchaeobius iranensis]|uniref:PQQ-like domain-containing protein n=1 Tax=Haloarchaeobius iranensis TaxID=996166 RepID=A0A1H0A839_9EURY|nr:PQQ-binding-like beta-propeller repeat protein [Haloarchaeobius iranensis]SDN29645.1 PQQ-like domain-containing protein [Haloarchaeobius iranensis]